MNQIHEDDWAAEEWTPFTGMNLRDEVSAFDLRTDEVDDTITPAAPSDEDE